SRSTRSAVPRRGACWRWKASPNRTAPSSRRKSSRGTSDRHPVSGAPRVLYYALGGGLGHLVRAGRFLRAQNLAENALILSASEHADDARLNSGVAVARVPWE